MAQSILNLQIAYSGKSPIVAGDKRLTDLNIRNLLYAIGHGSQYREPGTSPYIQYQQNVVQASATATCAAVANADTVTIAGTALTAAQKRATGTLTCATAIAGNTFVLNGVTFTGVAGAAVPGEATFSIDTGNAETATSIITQVNAYDDPAIDGIVAARATVGNTAVVTLYAINQGTTGNAITLAGTAVTLAASGATLANGAVVANNAFDWAGTNETTAAALAYAINNSTTAAIQQASATVNGAVVTVTSKVGGLAGNTITFVSNNGTRLAVTGSGFLANGAAGAAARFVF
jgi:hypothetical protein